MNIALEELPCHLQETISFLKKVYSFLSLVAHYLEYKQMVTKTGKFCRSCVPS